MTFWKVVSNSDSERLKLGVLREHVRTYAAEKGMACTDEEVNVLADLLTDKLSYNGYIEMLSIVSDLNSDRTKDMMRDKRKKADEDFARRTSTGSPNLKDVLSGAKSFDPSITGGFGRHAAYGK